MAPLDRLQELAESLIPNVTTEAIGTAILDILAELKAPKRRAEYFARCNGMFDGNERE